MSALKLIFLGTGSGKPTPGRNVSGMGMFREGQLFLFDCGEGTQVQMMRTSLRPGALAGVFLTHFHGDHVNGLPGLLGTLTLSQREEALPVFGPRGLKKWFRSLRELGILNPGYPVQLHEIEEPGTIWTGDGFHIEAQRLEHGITCWGYALVEEERPGRFDVDAARALGVPPGPMFGKLQRGESVQLESGDTVHPDQVLGERRPGLRVAYCCDTRPCEGARLLARDADILIHESTYPAGEERTAHRRMHSTAGDAARCARDANAHQLILTHFSQKHPRTDEFIHGARAIFPKTRAARDLYEYEVTRRDA